MKKNIGKTIWFTGLSGSGKSTLSTEIKTILEQRNINVVLLDGDLLRSGLNRDLGFSAEDRAENIRRAGETAKILCEAGHTVLAAFITPLETLRRAVRNLFDPGSYLEIYLECSLSVCENRDPKGLYKKARQGAIPHFTGISSPFEIPQAPDLLISTDSMSTKESTDLIMRFLDSRFPDIREGLSLAKEVTARRKKVAVIGLDGVPASLIFDRFRDRLPTFRLLMEHGIWGPLKSTDPPITIPAWACMTTGKDPGELGIYGFRNRASYDYSPLRASDSSAIKARGIWDYVEDCGGHSILIGIPQTFPAKKHHGITISGFPASRNNENFTYPPQLNNVLDRIAGGTYLEDIREFRNRPLSELATELHQMVERRFRVMGELMITQPWDFLMMVEIAPDRAHHMFWRFFDPNHPKYEPDTEYEYIIPKFYDYLDSRLNSLLSLMDDDTTVIIVSDHGAMPCEGGVCINRWLIDNGYLFLNRPPSEISRLDPGMVDWSRTTAWSEGGYYGRIFLNVRNREPQGIIDPENYETFRDELARRLELIDDGHGNFSQNTVLKPDHLYNELRNTPPDLMIYFDGLKKRALSSVGPTNIFVDGDGYSLDDCNHDPYGIFICVDLSDLRYGRKINRNPAAMTYRDLFPLVLGIHGIDAEVNTSCPNNVFQWTQSEQTVQASWSYAQAIESLGVEQTCQQKGFSQEEQEIVKKRLEELGYI